MAKKRIVVMYGGKADEHSISCISAASALRALDTDKFEAIPVGITKDGKWIVNGENPLGWSLDEGLPTVEKTPGAKDVVLEVALGQDGFFAREDDGTLTPFGHVDAVFPVLHGPYGEDGTIQGLFEMMGVPYVGCGVLASAACMDKHYTKVLLAAAGIPVAPGITLDARSFDKASEFKANADAIMAQVSEAGLQYPLFVKPSRAGSSFGVTKVEHEGDAAELAAAVYEASHHDWRILVEQGIDAREIECAVLGNDNPIASGCGEIVVSSGFYSYDSKYIDGQAAQVVVPAAISHDASERIRSLAIEAFEVLGCAGLARVDVFLTQGGEVLINEINSLPGFTRISMYPKLWQAAGMSYSELVSRLIELALERHAGRKGLKISRQ